MSIARKILMGAAGAGGSLPYVDDVFSTYVYKGTGATQTITNSIDVSGDGGLVWIKNRTLGDSYNFNLYDTERGATKFLVSNNSAAEGTNATGLDQFNNNGFRLGADSVVNASNKNFLSWTFRKAPGFFDVVTYTGTGSARTIAHNLGSVPGCIMVKNTSSSIDWTVWHRGAAQANATNTLTLNSSGAAATNNTYFDNGSTPPTKDNFTVHTSNRVNANGETYVAYVFAGGESTAATARSVEFDGSNDELKVTNSNSDFQFGTGDFTVEVFVKYDEEPSSSRYIVDMRSSTGTSAGALAVGYSSDNAKIEWAKPNNSILNVPWVNYISVGTWNHIAVARSGSTIKMFINGTEVDSATDNNDYTSDPSDITIGDRYSNSAASQWFNGKISNVRIVKGTAVYTSSFKPPTEPLTNITNTKLLCCNDSSTTGSTVTPGTITANSSPTASTDSPFDDPAGFVFGENEDQPIIKMGTFVGNGNNSGQAIEGPMVDVGWEPSWVLTKATTVGEKWNVFSSMTTNGSGFINFVCPNETDWEGAYPWFKFNSRGFQPKVSHDQVNANGQTYIYVAIRRPDGAVGKPPEVGTDAFAMATGNSSATIPSFDSNFPVDFAFNRAFAVTEDWVTGARLIGTDYLRTNTTNTAGTDNNMLWDSNTGYTKGYASASQAWMWKRGQGCDVVTYKGNGVAGHSIPHSLSKSAEMIWVKKRSAAEKWMVGHKGLNGGVDPWGEFISLNETNAEVDSVNFWNDTAPTATHFTLGSGNYGNTNNETFIAFLFASVEGISKVGSYTGTGSSGNSVSLGFQPRFLIVKNASWSSGDWFVYDTTRGWVTGNDSTMLINSSAAQVTGSTFDIDPTSTGFTVQSTDAAVNQNGHNFIYYAHA